MSLGEAWNDLDTGIKVVVGFGVAVGALLLVVGTVLVAGVAASFVFASGETTTGQAPPQVAFSFDLSDDRRSATIIHDAGDTIQADRLTVEVGDRTTGWDGGGDGAIAPGDTTTVETRPGETVTLVWRGETESQTLATFDVPDG